MTPEERKNRLSHWRELELKNKKERNFQGLVFIYDELSCLEFSIAGVIDSLTLMAYCAARAGNEQAMSDALQRLKKYSVAIDPEAYERIFKMVFFFKSAKGSELHPMHMDIIKTWLMDPEASVQVKFLLFDLDDILDGKYLAGHTNPIRNELSEKLIQNVFLVMMIDQGDLYYNKQTNDLEQEQHGYLVSHMADAHSEHEKLKQKILHNAPKGEIKPGVHFLIPKMGVDAFCGCIRRMGAEIDQFNDFISEFVEVQHENNPNTSLYFDDKLMRLFLDQLTDWCDDTGTDPDEMTDLFYEAGRDIALSFILQGTSKNLIS